MSSLNELSSPALLTHGATYYARLVLMGLESTFGTSGAVRSKLEALGFASVDVWTDAPAIIPDKSKAADGSTYFARGVWSRDTTTKAMPHQVTHAWVDAETLPPQEAEHAQAASPPVEVAPEEPAHVEPPEPEPHPLSGDVVLIALALLYIARGR